MSQTIPAIAFAGVLSLAAVIAAIVASVVREPARSYLRFAAGLSAALAVADVIAALVGGNASELFAGAISLLIAALVPACLALAAVTRHVRAVRTPAAAVALAVACIAGLVAAATGSASFAFVPLLVSAVMLVGLGARAWPHTRRPAALLTLSGVAFLAAGASYMSGGGGRVAFGLFCASGLLGASLALALDAAVQRCMRNAVTNPTLIGGKD